MTTMPLLEALLVLTHLMSFESYHKLDEFYELQQFTFKNIERFMMPTNDNISSILLLTTRIFHTILKHVRQIASHINILNLNSRLDQLLCKFRLSGNLDVCAAEKIGLLDSIMHLQCKTLSLTHLPLTLTHLPLTLCHQNRLCGSQAGN